MHINLHSYTFRDRPLADAFQTAAAHGYDGLELSRVHFDETQLSQELPKAIALGQRHTLPLHCVDFAADLINEDDALLKKSSALLEKNISICAAHGIKLMNGYVGVLLNEPEEFSSNGSALATDAHYQRAAAALRHLGNCAGQHQIKLALEIHMNTIHDTVASMSRLLDLVNSEHIVATPDPGNMFATCPEDRDPNALDALRGRIGYFHFKNCRIESGTYDYAVGLKHGDIDSRKYLRKLTQLGYNGPVCIEHVGDAPPATIAEEDIAYLRQ